MRTDAEIKIKGIEALIPNLDEIDVERFITLIMRETSDYTEWQIGLWVDNSVKEISKAARKTNNLVHKKLFPNLFV